jgi:hypothetical protein
MSFDLRPSVQRLTLPGCSLSDSLILMSPLYGPSSSVFSATIGLSAAIPLALASLACYCLTSSSFTSRLVCFQNRVCDAARASGIFTSFSAILCSCLYTNPPLPFYGVRCLCCCSSIFCGLNLVLDVFAS